MHQHPMIWPHTIRGSQLCVRRSGSLVCANIARCRGLFAIILSPWNGKCATVRSESPGYGSLSVDQVRADWILRDVSDIEFQHVLKEARTLGVSTRPSLSSAEFCANDGEGSSSE